MSLLGGLRALTKIPELLCRPLGGVLSSQPVYKLHTSSPLCGVEADIPMVKEPQKWLKYNDVLYPPQKPGEPRRPAEVVHQRSNVKGSVKKMWYISSMIRGMSIDEAIKQMTFHRRKQSEVVKAVLEEAQELAVKEHNVEFKSNLWVEDSFVRKGRIIKGVRKCARGSYKVIRYRYCNYFVRLREGSPPEHYYAPPDTGNEKMEKYITRLRERHIRDAL